VFISVLKKLSCPVRVEELPSIKINAPGVKNAWKGVSLEQYPGIMKRTIPLSVFIVGIAHSTARTKLLNCRS
jgi:hypothetical protein